MAVIHVLSQDTINQIAAGEVVERPMAVVKELVENAIDAGATMLTIEIKDGGTSLIRLTDNGSGIEEEDIRLAFTPHATSKIQEVADLQQVSTLGFRGEALASIAAVSQLEMVTKTRDALMGYRYCIEGGEEKAMEAIGCPEGTTFLVRNLFYNTPARLKFLKTPATEAGYINALAERLALSRPDISFRFINQNQTRLHTSGNGNLRDVIYQIYGRDIAGNLLELEANEVSCKVSGFIGKPVISRGNRNFMNYFINGRYIKSTVIHKAIEDAYAPYSMQHRYPFTALHFTIDPQYIDINVHPQKMEIRFTDAQGIYQSVYHAVSLGLKKREHIPAVTFGSSGVSSSMEQKSPVQGKHTEDSDADSKESRLKEIRPKEEQAESVRIQDFAKRTETVGKDIGQSAGTGIDEAVKKTASGKTHRKREPESFETRRRSTGEGISPSVQMLEMVKEQAAYGKAEQESLFGEGLLSDKALKECRIVGQVFATYWIVEYEGCMYLIDQHAAHEKVLYERFMKQLKEKKAATQLMQPPLILTLSMAEEQAVREHQEIFEQLGYQIEPFGGREYAVTGVPAHLPSVGEEELLKEVIDTLVDEHGRETPEILLDKVASMSCKAAVKGNNRLPEAQIHTLLKELMTLENPYHCPHGRPTMIKMTKQELEKKFKRIV